MSLASHFLPPTPSKSAQQEKIDSVLYKGRMFGYFAQCLQARYKRRNRSSPTKNMGRTNRLPISKAPSRTLKHRSRKNNNDDDIGGVERCVRLINTVDLPDDVEEALYIRRRRRQRRSACGYRSRSEQTSGRRMRDRFLVASPSPDRFWADTANLPKPEPIEAFDSSEDEDPDYRANESSSDEESVTGTEPWEALEAAKEAVRKECSRPQTPPLLRVMISPSSPVASKKRKRRRSCLREPVAPKRAGSRKKSCRRRLCFD